MKHSIEASSAPSASSTPNTVRTVLAHLAAEVVALEQRLQLGDGRPPPVVEPGLARCKAALATLDRLTDLTRSPPWGVGDVLDAAPAIRCHPAVGVVFSGPDGPVLSIDPCDGGNVSVVHLGDVLEWRRQRELGAERTMQAAAHELTLPIGPVVVVAHYRNEHMCSSTIHPERKPAVIAAMSRADLDLGLHGLTEAIVCERGGKLVLLLVEPDSVACEPIILHHGTSFTAGETTLHFLRDDPMAPAFYSEDGEQVVSLQKFKEALALHIEMAP